MSDDNKKPLKLVKIFKDALDGSVNVQPVGYEKIDDERVLERYRYTQSYNDGSSFGHDPKLSFLVETVVYDFKLFRATTTTTLMKAKGYEILHTNVQTTPFSQIENKQAIIDAHRALVELKGNPPSLSDILGYSVKTREDIHLEPPLKLKEKGGSGTPEL